jgi:hypothetical protein
VSDSGSIFKADQANAIYAALGIAHELIERENPGRTTSIVDQLNPVLRGWGAYFRKGNSSQQFRHVDEYVRERLALFLNKKAGRQGRGWKRHPLAFFRALGVYELAETVAWHKATPTAVR